MRLPANIERILKQLVLCGIFLFLFIPLIQTATHVKWEEPLNGAFNKEKDAEFSWKAWFSGEFPEQKDKWLKENFGLRDYLIRVICQINFSLFKTTNTKDVVIGKENYLYEKAYIDAYYGRDFIGNKRIEEYAKKLKLLQDTLQRSNKLIMTVFAPGKASFYPEYIPDNYKSEKTETNYEGFIRSMNAHGLNHIDFYKFFNDQKTKSKYPLYPQLGIHWSDYGSVMAFDSITRYVESKLNIDLTDLEITKIIEENEPHGTDNDAVKSLNLFRNPKTFKMAYSEWLFHYDPRKHRKPTILVIADSFWWHIYSSTLSRETYAASWFWYYNLEMYPESYKKTLLVSQVDYAARIRKADVILIMHSEATLKMFSCGFIDMCHETFFEPDLRQKKIQDLKGKIRATKEWYDTILETAKRESISIDSALTLNAIYVLEQERK